MPDEPALVCLPQSEDDKEKQEVKNLAEPTAKRQICITPCLNNFRVICKESRSDSKNDLPSCDDFSSINVPHDNFMTFSNPLFEFDVNFNNPLFDEELEDIECKDLNESNLMIRLLFHTSFYSNKDESLIPRDDIEFLLHDDPSTPLKSVASNLEGFIEDPPFEENEFDLECKMNDEAECFNPGGDNDEIDAFLAIEAPYVRILQKSQENGQNRTNTDTGTELSVQKPGECYQSCNQLKNKSFDEVQKAFDKTMSWINSFVPIDSEVVKGSKDRAEGSKTRAEGSSKRAGEDLQQESTKKQKIDDDKKKEEFKQCFEIVPDDGDDVTIDATPFKMLKQFDRGDLEVLWRIVKVRFKKTKTVDYMDTFLLLTLKTMFEHHVEDEVWKRQQGLVNVLNRKLFYSCGVHCVTVQSIPYYLLVEKMYPLTKHTLYHMFNNVKLQVDYECEMAFDLFRLVKKQLKEGYIPE
ncbi:hypothetical protein Tco_1032302 [Tanacetum coccineum]|uniref:Uncharacterized protein n=1 Tax=Tanacetum coccineum TaxID=301880 RepID=A0ABQ5GCV5_9ASTR